MFKNLKWNAENVWVGDVVFKFYHSQKCPNCEFCGKGFNDLRSEGPWNFTCHQCRYEWRVFLTKAEKVKRSLLLASLVQIDIKISYMKLIGRKFKKR